MFWVAGIALIVGGFIVITADVPMWRLYDKNWNPLAMTEAENYCVGQVLGKNALNNTKDDPEVAACVAASRMDNATPNIAMSIEWGCKGIYSTYPDFLVDECKSQIEEGDLWFLQHGGYTWEWSESGSNKRPVASHSNIGQPPRGERNDSERENNEERSLG